MGEGEGAEEEFCIDLFNAVTVTGVLEMDHLGKIIRPACCNMHLSGETLKRKSRRLVFLYFMAPKLICTASAPYLGPLFGVLTRTMTQKSVRKYMQLPAHIGVIKALMTDDKKDKKKTALKNSHLSVLIGSTKTLNAAHVDGRPMEVDVECVAKEGPGRHYLLRMKIRKPAFGPSDFPKLVQQMLVQHVPDSDAAQAAKAAGVTAAVDEGYNAAKVGSDHSIDHQHDALAAAATREDYGDDCSAGSNERMGSNDDLRAEGALPGWVVLKGRGRGGSSRCKAPADQFSFITLT